MLMTCTKYWCRHLCCLTLLKHVVTLSIFDVAVLVDALGSAPSGAALRACSQCWSLVTPVVLVDQARPIMPVRTSTEGAPVRKLAEADADLRAARLRGASDAELQRLESNVTDKKHKHNKTKWGTLPNITCILIRGYYCARCSLVGRCDYQCSRSDASVYMIVCVTLHTVTRAQRDDVASRIFVAAQVSRGLYVDGWEHLSSVPLGYAVDRLRAVLEWGTEVLDRVFEQLQHSDDILALDAMLSAHGDQAVCVSDFTTISTYIGAVGIRL
eukprot:1916-Heterococcus_DN1.PRE.1